MSRDWNLVWHSVLFVLGFTVVFAIVGVLIEHFFAHISYTFKQYASWVGGVIIIFFGLLITGLLNIPFLNREKRLRTRNLKHPSATSFLFGASFGAGWSPCVGAILGAIITLAATQPSSALLLMLAYSLGLGVPFIIAGFFAQQAQGVIKRLGSRLRHVQVVLGALLILLGVLILTNHLVQLAELTATLTLFNWIDTSLASAGVGVFVAFVAGLASFLSPCVLPLLPVYLAYLAGLTLQNE